MPRNREFDHEQVLDGVVRAFWEQGYGGTSIQQLEEATGLGRGSLYNAFGDKDALMLAALDRYRERYSRQSAAALTGDDPVAAVERFLASQIARLANPETPPGCLMVMTLQDAAGRGDAVERKAVDLLFQTERALYELFRRAQTAGRLDPDRDPRALARFYIGITRGMAVVHRATKDLTMVEDMATVAIEVVVRAAR